MAPTFTRTTSDGLATAGVRGIDSPLSIGGGLGLGGVLERLEAGQTFLINSEQFWTILFRNTWFFMIWQDVHFLNFPGAPRQICTVNMFLFQRDPGERIETIDSWSRHKISMFWGWDFFSLLNVPYIWTILNNIGISEHISISEQNCSVFKWPRATFRLHPKTLRHHHCDLWMK